MVATTFLIGGVALSHRIEPDVVVRKVTVASDTPALRFLPTQPGPHPVALLAHGAFCSKEMFFRYAEALAHAGFECVAIDFPGHGESPQPFTLAALQKSLIADARAVGPIDVFVGHSMGGYVGGEAAREGGLSPRLFIAIGSLPELDKSAPPLLIMSGQLDEFIRAAWVRGRTDARVEIFPWCDHVLELYDARLVNAAVEAACAAVGKAPPSYPTRWRWRLIGMVLGGIAAVGLAKVALVLGRRSARWGIWRGPLFSIILLGANVLVMGTWIGAMPHWRRLPYQIGTGIVVWLVVTGLGRLGLPRWTLLALAGAIAVVAAIAGSLPTMLFASFFFMALLAGTICGAIVSWRAARRDGDITLAIFAGYAVGQWMIIFF
jgi:pimeloyl-ACP methyl ester carboxylesterase